MCGRTAFDFHEVGFLSCRDWYWIAIDIEIRQVGLGMNSKPVLTFLLLDAT